MAIAKSDVAENTERTLTRAKSMRELKIVKSNDQKLILISLSLFLNELNPESYLFACVNLIKLLLRNLNDIAAVIERICKLLNLFLSFNLLKY